MRVSREQTVLRVAGAGLLAASAGIHLDLYLTGYNSIPTIGWLFLFQVITGLILAAAAVATPSRLVAAAAAGFALATLGGYLVTVWFGLFGFTEVRTTAGIVAGVIEIAAFAALALAAFWPALDQAEAGLFATYDRWLVRVTERGRAAAVGIAAMAIAALALLGVSVANIHGQPSVAASGNAALKTATIAGVTVLTNAKGLTLYWFAPDSPTASACNGSCAAYWPPLIGVPQAGSGVTGRLGTIKRADRSTQATYDGHPLYTYIGDHTPGQANGNKLKLNGGLWYEVRVSG
jgi:predicted lipoprotein with Yx(FWY)xxD motif